MKRSLNFIFYLCLGIALLVSFPAVANRWLSDADLPKDCLPKEARTVEILAHYENYWWVRYPDPDTPESVKDLLIQTVESSSQCTWVMGKLELSRYSLAAFIGRDAARQLSLDRYNRIIKRVGREALALGFSDEDPYMIDGSVYIFPEDKWALDQLKIPIGSRFQVVEEYPWNDAEDPTRYLP